MSVVVVNHGIQYGCSVLATTHHIQIFRHLLSLFQKHEYCDEEMGVSMAQSQQLHGLCKGSLSKYLSFGELFGRRVPSVSPHLTSDHPCCL